MTECSQCSQVGALFPVGAFPQIAEVGIAPTFQHAVHGPNNICDACPVMKVHIQDVDQFGFYFGELHGCLLLPQTGKLDSNVSALFTCSHPDAARGYYVGRRDCFMDTISPQLIYTDSELLEELRQIALDLKGYPDEENSWYYSIGCVLGNLSVQVFPPTSEERQQWEAEYRRWREEYQQGIANKGSADSCQAAAFQEA